MEAPVIVCPKCSTNIKLDESLAGPLIAVTKREYELKLTAAKKELSDQEKKLQAKLKKKLEAENERLFKDAKKKAVKFAETELKKQQSDISELNELLDNNNEKLAEAQKTQTDFLKKQRQLDEDKRELELTLEKRLQEALADIQKKAKSEAEDGFKMQVTERDQKIQAMKTTIDELNRRSEQGSQQLQGEVLEIELEQLLQRSFASDTIAPVPKGEIGADVLQHVQSNNGQNCGLLLWEMKRTKNWSDQWLAKLRDDQRAATANIAIIVTQTLPKDVDSFSLIDGVWVTSPRHAIPLAVALRQSLIEIANAQSISHGQETKMELVYEYLTGAKFKHRIEAIVEKFSDMREDLDRERKSMTRMWAKREAQIDGVVSSTVGLHGDLQGIAGKSILEIESLDLPTIELSDNNESSDND